MLKYISSEILLTSSACSCRSGTSKILQESGARALAPPSPQRSPTHKPIPPPLQHQRSLVCTTHQEDSMSKQIQAPCFQHQKHSLSNHLLIPQRQILILSLMVRKQGKIPAQAPTIPRWRVITILQLKLLWAMQYQKTEMAGTICTYTINQFCSL